MNYNLPHHFASAQPRSPQEEDGWEPGGAIPYTASPIVYTVTAPPTTSQHWSAQTSPSMSSYTAGYYQSTTQAGQYAHSYGTHHGHYSGGQTLPPPQPSPYSRGLSLGDYHYSRQGYDLSPTGSSTSPGWDPITGTSYPNYPYDAQPGSESGSSEDRDPSPLSENGNQAPSASNAKAAKEKKWICYRVQQSSATTCGKAFARKADLQRHEGCVHDKDKMSRYDCTVRKCTRKGENGFLRRDHLTEHLRHFHSKDIPKKHRRSVSNVEDGEEEEEPMQQHHATTQYFNP